MIELVNKIRDAERHTEEENDAYLDIFLDNVPNPNASDYIYGLEYEDFSILFLPDYLFKVSDVTIQIVF